MLGSRRLEDILARVLLGGDEVEGQQTMPIYPPKTDFKGITTFIRVTNIFKY
jgi:hypothetical protein